MGWDQEPGITMLCEVAAHLAGQVRGWAEQLADGAARLPGLPAGTERDELAALMALLADPPRAGTANDGLDHVGDFLVMLDMSAAVWGLKARDDVPGPVARAGWVLQDQAPVFAAARDAARAALDGDPVDLTGYEQLVAETDPPPSRQHERTGRHLRAVPDPSESRPHPSAGPPGR